MLLLFSFGLGLLRELNGSCGFFFFHFVVFVLFLVCLFYRLCVSEGEFVVLEFTTFIFFFPFFLFIFFPFCFFYGSFVCFSFFGSFLTFFSVSGVKLGLGIFFTNIFSSLT